MPLKFLRRVNRFSSRSDRQSDVFAEDAFAAVSTPDFRAYVERIATEWHRPSADQHLLEENLMRYDTNLPARCVDGDYLAILKKTLDELRPSQRIIPLTLGAAAKSSRMPRTTSPGFPWVTQGYQTKADVLDDRASMGKIHRAWDSIGRGIPWQLPDSLAFNRVVATEKERTKIRPVWGYPLDVIVEEARFFFPLMDHLEKKNNEDDTFYGLGMETMRSGHEHLARNMVSDVLCLAADFTSFDTNVTNWIIRDVFALVSDWFDFSKVKDSEGKTWNVNPDQTARRWKAMVSYFVNTKIRTARGVRVQKNSGVPSGSMFTNFIDTAVNAVQMRTAIRRVSGDLPLKDYYYGDDSMIFLDCHIDMEALASVLKTIFGGELSVDKTILSNNVDNIHWLGYFYRVGGPRRSFDFIIASTLFPERPVESAIDSCARLLGQLYSCMDPKLCSVFYDAIKWIMNKHDISEKRLNEYTTTRPSKAFKYLTTLGIDIQEVVLPSYQLDPFGGRFFPLLMPRPSPRKFVRARDRNLPEFAFIPEAYSNHALRYSGFHDYNLYRHTTYFDEHEIDEAYFTD